MGLRRGQGFIAQRFPAQGIAKCPCEAKALKEKQNGAFLYCIIRHLEGKKTSHHHLETKHTNNCKYNTATSVMSLAYVRHW